MGRLVKCAFCGIQVDKDLTERHDNKNYHPDCWKQQSGRCAVSKYVCNLFGLKKPGPVVYSQMKKYIEQGMTYEGILNALKYFYEVKKGKKDKANGGIGIVPYIYEEAQNYYKNREIRQEIIADNLERQFKKQPEVIKVAKKVEEKKPLYDLDNLF